LGIMNDHDNFTMRITRRGLIVGAVAAAGLAATGLPAAADPAHTGGSGPGSGSGKGGTDQHTPGSGDPFRYEVPTYQTTLPGESVESARVDMPVAPGIVLTSFDIFGRTGWLRTHVLNADLTNGRVDADLVADKVSDPRALSVAADAQHAVAAVNGDFFDITETFAAEGPEIQDGQLRKGTSASSLVATIGADRVARLADMLIKGTVTVAGTPSPLAALNSESVPADGIDVFTPLWGAGDRTLIQNAGPYTELVVSRGRVTAVNNQITTTAVPAGGLVVLGRGAAATRLAGTRVGDPVTVTFQPQSDSNAPLHMALGSNSVIVKDGVAVDFPPDTGNDAPKPRTAIGWCDGGRRLLLVAVDGAASFSAGLSYDDMAKLLVRLGATEAFMLDGGGSTEIVARHHGDAGVSVVNTPSDGNERLIPSGVGLFAEKGSGGLHGLDVRPRADRVVTGLSVDVTAAGYDETYAAVPIGRHPVSFTANPGSLGRTSDGVFHARQPGAGTLRAQSGSAKGEVNLRVLGQLHRLAFSERAVTIDPGATAGVQLIGYDADGFDAPVAPRDVALDYDHSVIQVTTAAGGGLTVTGGADAGGRATTITATAQGVTAKLPVTVGLIDISLAEFEPAEKWTATSARGSATVASVAAAERPGATADNHAVQLTYDFTGQTSTSAAYAVANPPITLPTGAKKLALWVNGDGRQHWLRAMLTSAGTTNVPFTFAQSVDWTGWQRVIGDIPTGFAEPIALLRVYIAETSQTNKNAGVLEFDGLVAQVGQQPDTSEPPQPDPYVLEQAGVGHGRWTFAILSDLHVSAAAGLDSFPGRQAAKALDQAVAAGPDFLLISGDFVDDDNPADFALANGLLQDHVPANLPVYWVPGNHEAGLTSTGGLDAFIAGTGRPTRQVFDHKGTRFILLDSHTGDLRTSDWDQVPLLQAELARAKADRSVTAVVVSFHHPLQDPTGTGASQLSDQLEADLLKRWLAEFREDSGKPVALITGHVHAASVTRADGLLEVTLPAVGKAPMASPDQGGFFGWMHVGVDPKPAKVKAGQPSPDTRDWLQAESRPVIDEIELSAPEQLRMGASASVGATGITSEFGLRFPLRFPASVTWSGGSGLAVVRAAADVPAARRGSKTLAVLDVGSGMLTAVRAGTVTLTVASGGLTATATVALTH
jgi:predicted phosphodiesterase